MQSYGFVVMCAIPRSGEKKASPPAPLQGERGVVCFVYCSIVKGLLGNSSTALSLADLFCFVHFSAENLTQRVPFLSTNCSLGRKKSILAEVCFDATKGQPVDAAK